MNSSLLVCVLYRTSSRSVAVTRREESSVATIQSPPARSCCVKNLLPNRYILLSLSLEAFNSFENPLQGVSFNMQMLLQVSTMGNFPVINLSRELLQSETLMWSIWGSPIRQSLMKPDECIATRNMLHWIKERVIRTQTYQPHSCRSYS